MATARHRCCWALATIELPEDATALDAVGARLSLEAIYQGGDR